MKKKAIEDLYKELKECGLRLAAIADALLENETTSNEETKVVESEPVKATDIEKKYTLEEVRAILSAKSKAGFREEVKALITKHGSDNLTKLDPNEYIPLVQEVEALSHE